MTMAEALSAVRSPPGAYRPVIERLEVRLNQPVVTGHQAMLWHALRRAGLPMRAQGLRKLAQSGETA